MTSMKSIPCKNCGNDLWEIWGNEAECTNCLGRRPFYHRKRGTARTPSQERAIQAIQGYFSSMRDIPLARFEITEQDGLIYVACETSGNVFTASGGHFRVGRRGGVTCLSVYDLCENKTERATWYEAEIWRRK
jgi:hypothetical protein